MRKRTFRIATAVVLLTMAFVLAFIALRDQSQDVLQLPLFGSDQTSGTTKDSTRPVVTPASLECSTDPQPVDDPVSITLVRQGMTMPVLSLGQDGSSAAAAPPNNESHTVAWFNEGPKVGSDMGKVVLSSHTFRFGGALGNELNDGLLDVGDVVLITGSDGSNICYRYSSSLHVIEADYDPHSDIVYDYTGAPQFALVVCSDYDSAGNALGRMIYYGDLMSGDAA
ncbi:hypothetical protein GCM10009785_19290 [Brooklawnia cerclae]|uniref:Class F sortase n=1 Tax=Brooklawnia cerclae TaxID=349934 RepID=A0ABX0SGI7_9ACTN|nr:class F sortase [Brooklawnia cerclae]NIH57498.1 hypothetical protein [Brooklawnia cerclae]